MCMSTGKKEDILKVRHRDTSMVIAPGYDAGSDSDEQIHVDDDGEL